MYVAQPRTNCPHLEKLGDLSYITEIDVKAKCNACDNVGENWICLGCTNVFCSRYVNKHMLEHFENSAEPEHHCVCLSFSDLSCWCYECEDYISHKTLDPVINMAHIDKFGVPGAAEKIQVGGDTKGESSGSKSESSSTVTEEKEEEKDKTSKEETKKDNEEKKDEETKDQSFQMKDICEGIKSGNYKNIVVLCGAGMSTAAGIPDFRSPKTGIYDNLEKFNLNSPTDIFNLDFFYENPKPFYELAGTLFTSDYKPTKCHKLLKVLEDHDVLLQVVTQNIDGLEEKTGLPHDKVVYAHGSWATASCLQCKKSFKAEYVEKNMKDEDGETKLPTCDECKGTIKPDITFFGERLPERFFNFMENELDDCDLLIVIGTSLSVYPVAMIPDSIEAGVPRMLWNRDKGGAFSYSPKKNDVWDNRNIEVTAEEFATMCGWKL
eukprot:gb/GECH01013262.1/.p1 GENE.gb/GECH01013262.1/~~gb/GECH01013262.1/.p1  ORF type:complete len:436 (+),score=121.50 gb/GECH01013262.1/:1-1308(+)